jgi:hypothetical protein
MCGLSTSSTHEKDSMIDVFSMKERLEMSMDGLIHSLGCQIHLDSGCSISDQPCQSVVYSLHSTPSPFNTARCPLLISLTVRHLKFTLATATTKYPDVHSPSQCHGHTQLGHQDLNGKFNTLLAFVLPKPSVPFISCFFCCNSQQVPILALFP